MSISKYIALFWLLADMLHWEEFKKHIPSELIFIFVPFGLALLSPRRLLTVFLGFSILLSKFVFLIFLFQSLWSALVTVVWAIALIRTLLRIPMKVISIPG